MLEDIAWSDHTVLICTDQQSPNVNACDSSHDPPLPTDALDRETSRKVLII